MVAIKPNLLNIENQQELLSTWNNTYRNYPQNTCLHQLFESALPENSTATAVIFEDRNLNYLELNQKANRLANYLIKLGVGPEVIVGVALERSLDLVISLFAILKAGGAYLPLDLSYPRERISFMLEDTNYPLVLTEERLLPMLPESKSRVICLDSEQEIISRYGTDNPVSSVKAENIAYVIYTSGSTGKPKGAMNTHRGICNRLYWMQDEYQLTPQDRVLQKTPFSFDVSVWEFFWPLMTGACLVVAKPGGHQDSAYLRELVVHEGITTLHFVPSMLQVFLEEPDLSACTSLKRVICSGEALPAALQRRFYNSLLAELHNLYGPTEAAVDVTYWACQKEDQSSSVPIGRPIANIQIYILDEQLRQVPIGATGEIYIGGVGLARGYLNRPELTAERFIPNPFSSEADARLYKTGDLARFLPDGNIEYLGRTDHQVKIHGLRIELGEIETTLLTHPAIKSCVITVREDIPGSKRLVAYLVPERQSITEIEEIRIYLRRQLPEFMVPAVFVTLDRLPLLPNGKIDRKALPVPDPIDQKADYYVAPHTTVAEKLATIWSDLLGQKQFGMDSNFFALGGSSIQAIQLISRVQQEFNVRLTLNEIFAMAQLADLAGHIENHAATAEVESPLIHSANMHKAPVSYSQERMLWFEATRAKQLPVSNLCYAISLRGELKVEELETAFREIVNRHESLRTYFYSEGGSTFQMIEENCEFSVQLEDLTRFVQPERETEIMRLGLIEMLHPFDFSKAPLFRVLLYRLSATEHVMVMIVHHLVFDGWSIGLLLSELSQLYKAKCRKQALSLSELKFQYKDFVCWQGSIFGEKEIDYWVDKLRGVPKLLPLPADYPRPETPSYSGANRTRVLTATLKDRLAAQSQKHGVTLYVILLAAFQTLLYHTTGQSDIVIGSPEADRSQLETESLIGLFVITLMIRTRLDADLKFSQLLHMVHSDLLEAYKHRYVSIPKVIERLQQKSDLGDMPLYQVIFAFQNYPKPPLEMEGLSLNWFPIDSATAKFDITLSMWEDRDGLIASINYRTEIFEPATIDRLLAQLESLLFAIAENPELKLSELATLPNRINF